jgi:hypothetical protein
MENQIPIAMQMAPVSSQLLAYASASGMVADGRVPSLGLSLTLSKGKWHYKSYDDNFRR